MKENTTSKKWSKTISLPKSKFPMRAELSKREPSILEFWERHKPYNKLLKTRQNQKERFILHDGPPYANGHFHVGHALNKILKDIINKYNLLKGAYVNYIPGWDCHGLPIELAVIKKLSNKKDGSARDPNKIRKACREYALKYIKQQAQDQTRMGVFWDNSGVEELTTEETTELTNIYYTMSRSFESTVIEIFSDLFRKKLIYKGRKPIHWCPSCRTALAEAEVEYAKHTSPSIYVKFPVEHKIHTYVVIWTTTPWTIPANLGVSFHPNFEYAEYETNQGNLIIAKGLQDKFFTEVKLTYTAVKQLSQEQINKLEVRHPFIARKSTVLFGKHVTLEAGTGIVHTAPGHGQDDYIIGKKYGLDILSPVDHKGCYTDEFSEMKGIKVFEANNQIIELLRNTQKLIFVEKIEHSYPHCWRCHKPLIFRAASQWFLSCETLKEKALEEVKKVKWIPQWGENRFRSTIANRPDWCLSRQRLWGVPIPAFTCSNCGKSYLNEASLNIILEKVKQNGIEVWFKEEVNSLLPDKAKCNDCGGNVFTKENDILDVWFDSGITWKAILKNNKNLSFPADLYLEGSDQHRGWFQSSLWPALALEERAPYLRVLTHGYVLDEKARAMSKSLGNVVSPIEDIIPKYGADILRLWVASEDYRTDNTISFNILNQLSDSYRKIRNTFRYLLGNLQDGELTPILNSDKIKDELDLWILNRLEILGQEMKKAYQNYEFHNAYQKALKFCNTDLSQIYFDIIRDTLYCDVHPEQVKNQIENTTRREAALITLSIILKHLNVWFAPILSFTMEEVYQLNRQNKEPKSIFEEPWPEASGWKNSIIEKKFCHILQLKEQINIKLELAREQKEIGSSIDSTVYISPNLLKVNISEKKLAEYLIVSKVVFDTICSQKNIVIQASKEEKCLRCWLHRKLIKSGLCQRCHDVIETKTHGTL